MGRVASEALALTWERRISRQRRSQLSVAEFCSQEGVSSKSFYVWRKRLREEEAGPTGLTTGAADPRSGCPASKLFLPVTLPLASVPAFGLRIELPSGAVLTLPVDAPTELVTAVIRIAMNSVRAEDRPSC